MLIEGIRSVATSYVPAVSQTAAAEVESTPVPTSTGAGLPYISPVLQYDSDAAMAVLMFRDGDSGSVETQYPSKRVIREYQLRGREGEASAPSSQAAPVDTATAVVSAQSAPSSGTNISVAPSVSAVSTPVASTGGGLAVNLVA